MDLTVRFLSRNLVTQTNFIEFRDSRIFHDFWDDGCLVDPKTGFLRKILKVGNDLSKVHFKII